MKNVKIEVLGSGCPKCKKLFELTKEVSSELGIDNEVKYSNDINRIVAMGIMSSPVVTIDGKPILVGTLPTKEKLKEIICKNVLDEKIKEKDSIDKNCCCSCGNKA